MKRLTKLSLAALVMVTSIGAYAGHHDEQRGGDQGDRNHGQMRAEKIDKMLFKLDLTEEQREQIEAVLQQAKVEREDEQRPTEAEREAQRQAMQELMDATTFDEAAATAIIEQRQQEDTTRKLAKMKTRHQLMQILTQEQRDQLEQQQQRKSRHHGRN